MNAPQRKIVGGMLVVTVACLALAMAGHAQTPRPAATCHPRSLPLPPQPRPPTARPHPVMNADQEAVWNSPNMLRARAWLQEYCATSKNCKPGDYEKFAAELENMSATQMKLWLLKFDEEEDQKKQQRAFYQQAQSTLLKQAKAADVATQKSYGGHRKGRNRCRQSGTIAAQRTRAKRTTDARRQAARPLHALRTRHVSRRGRRRPLPLPPLPVLSQLAASLATRSIPQPHSADIFVGPGVKPRAHLVSHSTNCHTLASALHLKSPRRATRQFCGHFDDKRRERATLPLGGLAMSISRRLAAVRGPRRVGSSRFPASATANAQDLADRHLDLPSAAAPVGILGRPTAGTNRPRSLPLTPLNLASTVLAMAAKHRSATGPAEQSSDRVSSTARPCRPASGYHDAAYEHLHWPARHRMQPAGL